MCRIRKINQLERVVKYVKFYLADTALRYSVLGYNSDSVASSLENVVYLELCRRGYAVHIGKTDGVSRAPSVLLAWRYVLRPPPWTGHSVGLRDFEFNFI